MKLTPVAPPETSREALFKALYGDVLSKADKKKDRLSTGDKALVATNAASAGLGALTMPALARDAHKKYREVRPKSSSPSKMGQKASAGTKKFKATPLGQKTQSAAGKFKGLKGSGSKKAVAGLAGAALGGAVFNATTDAASAVSINNKGKPKKKDIQKNLVLVSKSHEKASPKQILKETENPHVPAGSKMKIAALDKVETKVRQKAPAVKASVKAGTEAASDTWKAEAKVSKSYEDKREVYGWASITEVNGEPVVDLQGDYVTIDEIEKAAHAYISKSRKGGDMHRRNGAEAHHVADLIESVVITQDKKEALGIPGDSPTGWWIGMKVHDDDTWNLVKSGQRPMFSIHGSGKRIDSEVPDQIYKANRTEVLKLNRKGVSPLITDDEVRSTRRNAAAGATGAIGGMGVAGVGAIKMGNAAYDSAMEVVPLSSAVKASRAQNKRNPVVNAVPKKSKPVKGSKAIGHRGDSYRAENKFEGATRKVKVAGRTLNKMPGTKKYLAGAGMLVGGAAASNAGVDHLVNTGQKADARLKARRAEARKVNKALYRGAPNMANKARKAGRTAGELVRQSPAKANRTTTEPTKFGRAASRGQVRLKRLATGTAANAGATASRAGTQAKYGAKRAGQSTKTGVNRAARSKTTYGIGAGAAAGGAAGYATHSGLKRKKLESNSGPNKYGY